MHERPLGKVIACPIPSISRRKVPPCLSVDFNGGSLPRFVAVRKLGGGSGTEAGSRDVPNRPRVACEERAAARTRTRRVLTRLRARQRAHQ